MRVQEEGRRRIRKIGKEKREEEEGRIEQR